MGRCGDGMRATLNLKWHIPGLLATGGKTDTHEKLDWVISEGFSRIVVLEPIPTEIWERFVIEGNSLSLNIVKEEGDPPIKDEAEFIATGILHKEKVYIQCSTGAARSQGLARAFMEKCDLYIIKYLADRVDDLKRGDLWDHIRGNWAFDGDRMSRAISFLGSTLESEDEEVQLKGAVTLIELMDSGCFDSESMHMLNELKQRTLELSIKRNPKYTEDYKKIVNNFIRIYANRHLF